MFCATAPFTGTSTIAATPNPSIHRLIPFVPMLSPFFESTAFAQECRSSIQQFGRFDANSG
jgi:hypothetical protein